MKTINSEQSDSYSYFTSMLLLKCLYLLKGKCHQKKIVRSTKLFSTKQKRTTTVTISKPTQLQINIAKKTLGKKMQKVCGYCFKETVE